MSISKCYLLKDFGNFNGENFSAITFTQDWKFEYDILELSYKLSIKAYWFSMHRKRRENETTSVLSSTCNYIISQNEIINIPYFKQYFSSQSSEINPEDVEKLVNNNIQLLEALVNRYKDNLGSKIYMDENQKIILEYDRFSSINYLETKFIHCYIGFNEDLNSIKGHIKECVIYPY